MVSLVASYIELFQRFCAQKPDVEFFIGEYDSEPQASTTIVGSAHDFDIYAGDHRGFAVVADLEFGERG
jgi:hypothetical protein